jgi:3-isopropylmalate/(R)-2-methylmalate dehydratase small subunit
LEPFRIHYGLVSTLDRVNVDTDQMVPKQFLKRIERTGYGDVLFYDWRYLSDGKQNPDFELNKPKYNGTSILVTRENFGCGSSREHAVWAVKEYGFRVILSPSFADIFYNNCINNGVLPIVLDSEVIDFLFSEASNKEFFHLTVDLEKGQIFSDDGWNTCFAISKYHRMMLLSGFDNIGITLQKQDFIEHYEKRFFSCKAH